MNVSKNEIYKEDGVDINQYPTQVENPKHNQVTAGDLHANAKKFLHSLIKENVLNVGEQDFESFKQIYQKQPNEIKQHDLDTMTSILSRATAGDVKKIRLIGDEFADRGKNGLYILMLLKKLYGLDIDYEIIFSNHLLEFFRQMEENNPSFLQELLSIWQRDKLNVKRTCCLEKKFARSMYALGELIINPSLKISLESTREMLEKYYYPYLNCYLIDMQVHVTNQHHLICLSMVMLGLK